MSLRLAPLLGLLLLCLALAMSLPRGEKKSLSPLVGAVPAAFTLPSLADPAKPFSPETWKGKVVALNAFASWCSSCIAEHPLLLALAESGKVEILGLGWRDKPEKLRAWLKKRGNPYHAVGVDEQGKSTVALGLSGVPETFVFDKSGRVAYNSKAPLTEEEIHNVLLPLVERLQHE